MSHFKTAIKVFILMTILTGVVYPLLITGIAQMIMPKQANGKLIHKGEQIIGSELISQNNSNDRYFWPRPSAIDYDPIKPSGGSNLGPTSLKLKEIVEARKQKMGKDAPAELLYASGSGLDPHISLQTAYFQIPRIAKARSVPENQIKQMIESRSEGFLGLHYVNVLLINQAIDNYDRR